MNRRPVESAWCSTGPQDRERRATKSRHGPSPANTRLPVFVTFEKGTPAPMRPIRRRPEVARAVPGARWLCHPEPLPHETAGCRRRCPVRCPAPQPRGGTGAQRDRAQRDCAVACVTPALTQSVPEARQKSSTRSGTVSSAATVSGFRAVIRRAPAAREASQCSQRRGVPRPR
jgi:hypothetical protein